MTRKSSIFTLVVALAVALTPVIGRINSKPDAKTASRPTLVDGANHLGVPDMRNQRSQRSHAPNGRSPGADVEARGSSLSFAEARNFATHADPPSKDHARYKGDDVQNQRGPLSDSLAVGNFDEDPHGNVDVVQTNVLAGSISVFRGDGHGGFAEPTVIDVGVTPGFVTAADLDRDGHLDLVLADSGTDSNGPGGATSGDAAVITLRGDGHGGFAISNSIPLSPPPRNLALGDVNADGISDIVVATRGPSTVATPTPTGDVRVLIGAIGASGAASFAVAQTLPLTLDDKPVGANAVVLGDFDGVGGDDLAVGVGTAVNAGDRQVIGQQPKGDDLLVYLNRNIGGGAFGSSPSQRFRIGAFPNAIASDDWNGDAHTDLAVVAAHSGHVTSFTNDGKGHFTLKGSTMSVGALPRSLEVADFNNDGVADLATATFLMSTISVLAGRGDGTFEPAVDFWAGDEPTSVEVGLFDGDKRPDVVVGRVHTDELALLINESPRSSDGIVTTRDIPYVDPANDPAAAHHTLDVWTPAAATPSLAGRGKPYPVVVFAHGGAFIAGHKTHVSHLMRSLARQGVIGVTIDHRLDGNVHSATEDYADAFRWVRSNIGAPRFGGDPGNIVVAGTSAGATLACRFASSPTYLKEHSRIRGYFVVGVPPTCAIDAAAGLPPLPALAVSGDQSGEAGNADNAEQFVTVSKARGGEAEAVQVPGHDHFEVVANLARPGDLGRAAMLRFLQRVMG